MSSFLCFLCHSTVSSETNDDTRDKYREVVGMHLCPDSHLCYICCHILHKLCLFRAMCLKRSLEYPVLFSEKGTINLLRSDLDNLIICNEDSCKQTIYSFNKSLYTNLNCKTYAYNFNKATDFYETEQDGARDSHQYVNFDDRNDFDNMSNDSTELAKEYTDFENNPHENQEQFVDYDDVTAKESTPQNYHDLESVRNYKEEITENDMPEVKLDLEQQSTLKDLKSIDEAPEDTSKKKKSKTKKFKKRSFTKIVLSFQEQKTVLEDQRKGKKYLDAEFKCQSCALGFLFKDTYQSHMVRHEESNGQFSCNICGLRFATQNARCMHVILHAEVHRCNKCGAAVKRPHRNRHSRECWRLADSASCHLCGKVFKDGSCLQQHLKRYHEAKTSQRLYSCNICGMTYKEPAAVRTHMLNCLPIRKHINRRFDCPECPSNFTSPYTLNQHVKQHAAGRDLPRQYYCRSCDSWYKTQKGLNAHLNNAQAHVQNRIVNASSEPAPRKPRRRVTKTVSSYTCHLCGHQAKSLSKLNRHIKEVCERAKQDELASLYESKPGL